MRRPEPPLDAAIARDLEALDAALADAPDADRELLALVAGVRADAPRMDAGARAALDSRVAAGFPPAAPRARRRGIRDRRLPGGRRLLVPAAGTVAAGVIALGVVVAGPGGGGSAGGTGAGGGGGVAASKAAPAEQADRASRTPSAPAVPAPSLAAPPIASSGASAPARRVERTVRIELGARADRFDRVTDAVVQTTQRAGGFVASSQIGRDGGTGAATFVLKIPAARLDAAVSDLSRLAHVRSLEQATDDLTGATDGTRARLRDAQRRRAAIVSALATATGDREARLRARLAAVTAQVRRLGRALRALRGRTTYATVDLTVSAPRRSTAAPGGDDGRFTPAAAWRHALRGLEIAAAVLILGLAFVLPLAAVGGLAMLAGGAIRRRRREAALV